MIPVIATATPPSAPARTIAQQVLLAAALLEQQGHVPFTAEALIVTSWQNSPRSFGLKGYAEQYPDSNRILSVIMGKRGLATQGLLEKVGVKLYMLTERGRKIVARLESAEPDEPIAREKREQKKRLTKELERFLERITGSQAIIRFRTGMKQNITFRDACDFWGVQDRANVEGVQDAARKFPGIIAQIEQLFEDDKLQLSSGRRISIQEVHALSDLHTFLLDQFSRHMNMTKPRK
jgi:hypothetical protein